MPNRFIRRLALLVCATLLVMASPRPGRGQVLVVQGSAVEVYRQAVAGFTQAFTPGISLPGVSTLEKVEIVILDPASVDNAPLITQKYQTLQPDLIVAVGSLALKAVAPLPGPIIYLMVPDPNAIVPPRPGLTGVRMTVAPAGQLAAIKQTFPTAKRIGLLHKAPATGDFPALANEAAQSAGLTLVSIPAASDRHAIEAVAGRAGAIDVLLLTPEPSLISPTLLDALALVSLEKKIPLIAFAPKYLAKGAAVAIYASPEDMGRQAGKMARDRRNRVLGDTPQSPQYASEASILTNPAILRKIGGSLLPTTNKRDMVP